MTSEVADDVPLAALCLRITAELDASALPRVLHYFQNLNFIPRRVVAECSTCCELHIRVDVFGMTEQRLEAITRRAAQLPGVLRAHWHRL